jgi:uncharacterized protein YjiS (DUF1127 family)
MTDISQIVLFNLVHAYRDFQKKERAVDEAARVGFLDEHLAEQEASKAAAHFRVLVQIAEQHLRDAGLNPDEPIDWPTLSDEASVGDPNMERN